MRLSGAVAIVAAAALVAADARTPPAPAPEEHVAAHPLTLRVAADGGAPTRGRLPAGARYVVRARQGNWTLIRSGDQWGWLIAEELSPEP